MAGCRSNPAIKAVNINAEDGCVDKVVRLSIIVFTFRTLEKCYLRSISEKIVPVKLAPYPMK